jgi:hypothetical protein
MLKYCSRCNRTVLPNHEGNCPGCRSSMNLSAAACVQSKSGDPVTTISLRSHARFPDICPFCGDPSTDSHVVTWSRKSPHLSAGGTTAGLGLIGFLFDRLLRPQEQVISFRLPFCPQCRGKKLETLSIDWDDYSIDAVCAPAFKSAVLAASGTDRSTIV